MTRIRADKVENITLGGGAQHWEHETGKAMQEGEVRTRPLSRDQLDEFYHSEFEQQKYSGVRHEVRGDLRCT